MSRISVWWRARKQQRENVRTDARQLIERDERNAYYDANRLATRCRVAGDAAGFMHWCKVSAEVARVSRFAEMDMAKLEAAVEAEETQHRPLRK